MYKVTRKIIRSRPSIVLVRRTANDGTCSIFVLHNVNSRDYGTEWSGAMSPPPQPPKRGKQLLWSIAGITFVTGCAVIYAKQNPEFRNWITNHAPASVDEFFDVATGEKSAVKFIGKKWDKYKTIFTEYMFGKEGVTPEKIPTKGAGKPCLEHPPPSEYVLPFPQLGKRYEPEDPCILPDIDKTIIVKSDPAPEKPMRVTYKIPLDVISLETCLYENTKTAIDQYNASTAAITKYLLAVSRIMEVPAESFDKTKFDFLRSCQAEKDNALEAAVKAHKNTEEIIEEIISRVGQGDLPPEDVAAMKRNISKFEADIAEAKKKFDCEKEKSYIADKYWHQVECARTKFKDEIMSLFPNADIKQMRLNIKDGDPDLLLVYTWKYVTALNSELMNSLTILEQKVKRSIDNHKDKDLIEAHIKVQLAKEKAEMLKSIQKQLLDLDKKCKQEKEESEKTQLEQFNQMLKDRLAQLEAALTKANERKMSEELEAERARSKAELAVMAAKLKAIEDVLKARAQNDQASRQAQALWAAGEALFTATRSDVERQPIHEHIKAIEKAGNNDKLVGTVVKGIPENVVKNGVYTEAALRDRYLKMEDAALKVALVDKEGGSLPVYFLSWLQSKLLFTHFAEIPKCELEDEPTDFNNMDTFDIFQRSRYYIERGNIGQALRYVNLLSGAPARVAESWRVAALEHLETKQAAHAVMAHAAASALN